MYFLQDLKSSFQIIPAYKPLKIKKSFILWVDFFREIDWAIMYKSLNIKITMNKIIYFALDLKRLKKKNLDSYPPRSSVKEIF